MLEGFTFLPTLLSLNADFHQLASSIGDFREPLERCVRQVMAPSISRNFDVGGRPAWQPLEPGTQAQNQNKTLVRTGALQQGASDPTIWTYGSEEAFVPGLPEDINYGEIHQQGSDSRNIPMREFMVIQPEDFEAIDQIFVDWLGEKVDAAGFNG